ncbi:MAG: poly-gamma-glutamate system protein [Myxococcota bacterium]
MQLVFVCGLALLCLYAVEVLQSHEQQPYFREKLTAARTAKSAMDLLQVERLRRKILPDPESDPAGTGMIGTVISSITSGSGSLASKQTACNPNLAAVVVQWFKQLNLKRGDVIAVGMSGSFPCANIAVLAASHTLGIQPLIISSVAASQWGANHPEFTWLDMESYLYKRGVFPFRSIAASRGGVGDRGLGISKLGRQQLDDAMERNKVEVLRPKTIEESIEQRMAIYTQYAMERPILAYVNVGGGTVSVGTKVGKKNFKPGINRRVPHAAAQIPSVLGAFIKEGAPVIHISQLIQIAEVYGIEAAPLTLPNPGEGAIFLRKEHNRWLAAGITVALFALMTWLFRLPYSVRFLARHSQSDAKRSLP